MYRFGFSVASGYSDEKSYMLSLVPQDEDSRIISLGIERKFDLKGDNFDDIIDYPEKLKASPESVKLIIDCSEKPRDNALFYAFQVFKLFTHKVQLLLPIPPSPFPKGRGRLQGTAAGVLRTPAAWLK